MPCVNEQLQRRHRSEDAEQASSRENGGEYGKKGENMKLDDYREEIDRIDEQIIELFGRRMEVARRIGEYKKENGLNILDSAREEEKLKKVSQLAEEDMEEYCLILYNKIMEVSREYQRKHTTSK